MLSLTFPQLTPSSEDRSRTAGALLWSALVHGLLLALLTASWKSGVRTEPRGPLRLTGQTFQVEATEEIPIETEAATESPAPPVKNPLAATPQADTSLVEPRIQENRAAEPRPGPASNSAPSPQSRPALPQPGEQRNYGEAGAPESRKMDLTSAFLKVLPLAAKTQPEWPNLLEGDAGSVVFVLRLDGDGRLLPIAVKEEEERRAPAYLVQTVKKTRVWLLSGLFRTRGPPATSIDELQQQSLKLTATVSKTAPDAERADSQGIGAFGLRGSPPSGAYFTYFNGKHVELKVESVDEEKP